MLEIKRHHSAIWIVLGIFGLIELGHLIQALAPLLIVLGVLALILELIIGRNGFL